MRRPDTTTELASTGIPGLDDILRGGLPRHRIYLLQGDPGVGKTTAALQFLLEGTRRGEKCLYITLSETEDEVKAVAASHGWSLDGLCLLELSAMDQRAQLTDDNTLFVPADVELRETTSFLLQRLAEVRPSRVAFDSLSELRLLAQHPLRYRREILGFKQYSAGKNCTVLLLDDRTSEPTDLQVQSLAHGVLSLEHRAPTYGGEHRRLRVLKLRGVSYRGGYHEFAIRMGGLQVFPRLVAAEHQRSFARSFISSGLAELDQLMGGGIDRGTNTLIVGPAGAGKSTLAVQYAVAAASRGERAALLNFDEGLHTLCTRADSMGMSLSGEIAAGRVLVQQIDPAEMSPGEFAHRAQELIERQEVRLIVIDSLNGYLNSMPDQRSLTAQMHELLSYFSLQGVTAVLVLAQTGTFGPMVGPVDLTYLADSVVALRFFEADGRIRKAISVIKKRSGAHENTIREFMSGSNGIQVGPALDTFRGVLTGTPTYVGRTERLLGNP